MAPACTCSPLIRHEGDRGVVSSTFDDDHLTASPSGLTNASALTLFGCQLTAYRRSDISWRELDDEGEAHGNIVWSLCVRYELRKEDI
jgi:hypothetical protein